MSANASPTRVPLLDLRAQYETIRGEVRAAIDRVMEAQYFILGPEVEALERDVAKYSACAQAIGVTSGTDAILVGLMALGVGAGDEVLTTPYTFIATAGSIVRLGARPVFVDIDPTTYNIDASRLAAAITARTKAIMPVHLYGQMADMEAVMAVANAHKVPVIEDAAQAIGSERGGRRAGSIGSLGCLSFFPSKNLGGAGDGGAVVSNDEALASRVRLLRNQGQAPKYFSVAVGGNFRLDALQAAILRAKLPHLDGWTAGRQRNAARYRTLCAEAGIAITLEELRGGKPGFVLPVEVPGGRHVYNQFVIRSARREALKAHLGERGIGSEVYYPQPMHLQTCFKDLGFRAGEFPESERAANESLAIPIYPELTEDMQRYVVAALREFARA